MRRGRPLTRLAVLGTALVVGLSACSGDSGEGSSGGGGGDESSPAAAATPYLDVPDGVELTEQGSQLEVGDPATVAYEPRQNAVGALDITVTSMEKASFKLFEGWELTNETRKTAPYFVRATVRNVGDTDLGGRPVPLYIVDEQNRLIEASVFTGTFQPCEGSMFPKKFRNGARMKACLVYLAPEKGQLTAVSFRPDQEFDPITWTGELTRAGGEKKKQGGNRDRGGNNRGGGSNGGGGNGR